MSPSTDDTARTGESGWLDLAGFVAGLSLAWWQQWQTADLVWSLWLSSLVVGYAMIVWTLFGPAVTKLPVVWRDRGELAAAPARAAGGIVIVGFGMLFLLAFFTVHFGGFHVGHSVFLATFFPVQPGETGFPGWSTYTEVVRRYWMWLPVAFLAERAAFSRSGFAEDKPFDTAVTPEAIAQRRAAAPAGSAMMAPYQNVIRMHVLIFFFAAAHFAKMENFFVYAVVYAVYFAPWRRLARWVRPASRAGA